MSGSSSTASGISLPPREAIRFFLGKLNTPTRDWSEIWQEAHSRAFMVAGAASEALLADFREAITKALEQGTTLAEFRADFDAIVARNGWAYNGTPGWRAQIIYETNLSMAYSAGRYAQLTEPDTLAAFPYWQYVHSGAAHPRKQHLAWNGLTLRADDGFWRTHYPPNGWKCGCRVRPLSARDLGRQGKQEADQAPRIEYRPWRRPSDGQVLQVPDGIDPGFAYNPGLAWKQGAPAIPGGARLTPPAGWVPPVPAMPMAAPPAQRRASAPPAVMAADQALSQDYAVWGATLTREELAAIGTYRSSAGLAMNRVLRGEREPTADLAAMIETLKGALGRARAPRPLVVRRGASSAEIAAMGAAGRFEAFVSSSLDQSIAAAFAKRQGGRVIEIRVAAGTPGVAYVQRYPTVRPSQFEVLLAPGLGYRLVSRTGRRLVLEVYHV
jgi:hypothetical protein